MRKIFFILMSLVFCVSQQMYAEEKEPVKGEIKWEETENRDLSAPQLYKDNSYVYVYSEKQLDNLTIGITDIQGNVYHQEVTTLPACTYYAVSIESLPEGVYYLCIYQGSNYVMGLFNK